MNSLLNSTGQILGCTVFAMLLVRGVVALAYDFTKWTLRRNQVESDQ
ncbi:MAG: hypothetical protein WAM58_02525 [Candidatus Acidiferrum sp.]